MWPKVEELAHIADIELSTPCQCGRQTKRKNVPSATTDEYFKRAVFIPVIDDLMAELEFRFSCIQVNGTQVCILYQKILASCQMLRGMKYQHFLTGFSHLLPHSIRKLSFGKPNGR